MKYFREESEEGSSGLVYSSQEKAWLCGGSLGLLYRLANDEGEEMGEDGTITALTLSPNERMMAMSFGDSVSIREFPDVKAQALEADAPVIRRTLPISHLAFTKSSSNL